MSDFVLPVAMRLLFADAVSACGSVYFADDGGIVATLNRVDPVVVPTGTDLEGMTVSGIAIHATLAPCRRVLMTTWKRALQSIHPHPVDTKR